MKKQEKQKKIEKQKKTTEKQGVGDWDGWAAGKGDTFGMHISHQEEIEVT